MTDIPQRRVARTARLASLAARRRRARHDGPGQAHSRESAEAVTAELQQRTAEQLFTVLGELKGGAMKLGQALSVFEAALPEESAAPYRAALTRLQEAAPPMPAGRHASRARRAVRPLAGRSASRSSTTCRPPRRVSARYTRRFGATAETVAVKIQYPGAGPGLMADFTQLSRFARLFARLSPGLEIKPLLAELRERVLEELDYTLEADAQRTFARAYDGDPEIAIPHVVASAPKVIVTEWIDGIPLSRIIAHGETEQRDRAGYLLALLHYSAPQRASLLHADPHPGNFRLCDDGRLGVVDFGAVARLPGGSPEPLGRMTRFALNRDSDALMAEMYGHGFIRPGMEVDPDQVMDYLCPIIEPLSVERFTFTREWMRGQAARLGDPRNEEARVGRLLNLPPSYLLIHRVTIGSVAVLCQLGATAPYRALAERWQPGFVEPAA